MNSTFGASPLLYFCFMPLPTYYSLELSRPRILDLDITLEFEDGPNAPQPCDDVPGWVLIPPPTLFLPISSHPLILHSFATDASVEVLFPVEVWQHLSRIPWRRLQFRLPPGSTYSFGAIRPVGHVSVIGKVLPMMGVSAREEAFMELIIRLIDFDVRPATIASAPAASLQQARRSSNFSSQLLPNHCSFHLSSYSPPRLHFEFNSLASGEYSRRFVGKHAAAARWPGAGGQEDVS